jgi:hypothetical protein
MVYTWKETLKTPMVLQKQGSSFQRKMDYLMEKVLEDGQEAAWYKIPQK